MSVCPKHFGNTRSIGNSYQGRKSIEGMNMLETSLKPIDL
jgi:hypothetical protein